MSVTGQEVTVTEGDWAGQSGQVCEFLSTRHGVEVVLCIEEDFFRAVPLDHVRIGNPKEWPEDLDSEDEEEDDYVAS